MTIAVGCFEKHSPNVTTKIFNLLVSMIAILKLFCNKEFHIRSFMVM